MLVIPACAGWNDQKILLGRKTMLLEAVDGDDGTTLSPLVIRVRKERKTTNHATTVWHTIGVALVRGDTQHNFG